MSKGESESESIEGPASQFQRRPWGRGDLVALLVWTLAIAAFFWEVVGLKRALFYFDITEINYPYRAFFAEELKAGRFSRWFPGLYCGLPLFSESQAGYLHPFKYLLYPWLATWQALNLDTVLSIWLTGFGTYLWLRRHVGPAGALTGAAVFGLSGFAWGHLIHTSMINAMASVPFVILGLEWSWESGRWRGAVLGGVALACQVFAGHLQDALIMVVLVGLYGLYRAATERGWHARSLALGMAVILAAVGVLVSAVQWVPSKELLDRSPRAGGLPWGELVYASWNPELIPALVVREAYGTRARDTDWLHGFYPYHEMNAYMGLIAMALAVVGAGGMAKRDRWANFWVVLVGLGAVLMLGKFTFLFDRANQIPILGSSREPVRFHLWVSLGVAALSAVGVERLGRPGTVSLRGGLILGAMLVLLSIPIMIYNYNPVWNDPRRWTSPYHLDRYRWLGRELAMATTRTAILAGSAWLIARIAARSAVPALRSRWAALLPLLVMADLLGSHWRDVPTIEPRFWTEAPESAIRLKADPSLIRIFARGDKHSGEPGYASEPVDFFAVRDPLDWSLPPVWNLPTSRGNTPMISSRLEFYARLTEKHPWRHDLESDSHIITGRNLDAAYRYLPTEAVGTAACDLRLMPSMDDISGMPWEGKNLIVVANVRHALHFRIFDADGRTVVDTDEERLKDRAWQAEDLKRLLKNLWPPHELTGKEKDRLIADVTSLVNYTRASFIHRNLGALPRARLVGNPVYADDVPKAAEAIFRLGETLRNRVVVEDPTRPLPVNATVSGTARIVEDLPEKVVVDTNAGMPSYLVLSDTFDPGWTAKVDNRPVPIRPAYLAFRAVYLPEGSHTVVFTYRPAGFVLGLALTGCGIVLGLILWFRPRSSIALAPEHRLLGWPSWWRTVWLVSLGVILLVSSVTIGPGWRLAFHDRWRNSIHTHTWGSGMEAQKSNRM